jgi:large subunit ribosomal protein L22
VATVGEERTEVRAQARWVRSPARKARLVLDTIRGRSVPEARSALAFSTRAIAREIEKVLRSAVANAEQNHGLIGEQLYISACYADEGPTLKRWQARARGRAGSIHKGSCHITVLLSPIETEELDGARRSKRRAEAARPQEAETKPKRVRAAKAEAAPAAAAPEAAPAEEKAAPKTPRRTRTATAKDETKTKAETPKARSQRRVTRRKKEGGE